MRPKLSQVRSTGTVQILTRVQLFFHVEQGDKKKVKRLHEQDRFLYPEYNMVSQLKLFLLLVAN